ncbi:MAG: YitT family protein [Dysosmobacter welbionis]
MAQKVRSCGIITLGAVIYALAFDWFVAPNQIAMGGVTGLAQIVNALVPVLPVGVLSILVNVPLFLAGWRLLGGRLLVSSLYAMAVSSLAIDVIAWMHTFPPMDPILATLYGGAGMGVGLGLVFSQGATTGGTDIIGKLLKLKFPWLPIGKLVMIPDMVVVILAAVVFGTVNAALYGLIQMYLLSKVMDMILYGWDTSRVAYIITDRWEETVQGLLDMNRGVTLLQGKGAYTGAEKQVLLVAFRQREIVPIKRMLREIDPKAFSSCATPMRSWARDLGIIRRRKFDMADFTKVQQALERRGYTVRTFAAAAEAAAYLDGAIDGKTVGFGGSATLDALGVYDKLAAHNTVIWHWKQEANAARKAAMQTQVYLSSANGLAESGEIVNIDGTGNRVSATLFGHEKVYIVIGRNKLAPTYEAAVYRARNVAAPQRARQLGKKTPCAVKADRCYDCRSPERVCRALVTLWGPMLGMETEVLLVDEDLGL